MTNVIAKTSKMSVAKSVYAEVYSEGYEYKTDAKSPRAEFINRMMADGLKLNAAATYHQNIKNELAGKPLYYKSKKADKPAEVFLQVTEPVLQEEVKSDEADNKVVDKAPAKRVRRAKKQEEVTA